MPVGPVEKVNDPPMDDVGGTGDNKPVVDEKAVEPATTESDFYAWTVIEFGAKVDDNGHILERYTVKYGDKVDQSKLKVSKEEWAELITSRVVRKAKPPQVRRYESPKRSLIGNAARKMEAALAGDVV